MCNMYIDPDIPLCYNIVGGDDMAYSEAQKRATAKYMKENLDEIKLRVPKGRKDEIKAHAEQRGESLNGFISRAIDNQIERDNADK